MPNKKQASYREQAHKNQIDRWHSPVNYIKKDLKESYKLNEIQVGLPLIKENIYNPFALDNTVAIIGAQFGDEGKGRFVDNKVQEILKNKTVRKVYIIRYQGGANAGHTVEAKGLKLALHQVPSSVLEPKAIGIMDRGMVINLEDLKTEIEDIEQKIGSIKERLVLSEEALLNTDLDRALEILNRYRSEGKSKGGTTRGISTTYGDFYTRLGNNVAAIFADDWKQVLGKKYDDYSLFFSAYKTHIGSLDEIEVPDLRMTRDNQLPMTRKVGSKIIFLNRLEKVRNWFIERDKIVKQRLIQNTSDIHTQLFNNDKVGILFEGAQAVGLHAWLGRRPDVTASDTSAYGITVGTGYWQPHSIKEKIGVMKITYMSSVGEARMITCIDIPRAAVESTDDFNEDQLYGIQVREEAHERGTTTGRYRDICFLDLELMRYNIYMGGIELLAATHLDIAKKDRLIKVCTHYLDSQGNKVAYQPGIDYQKDLIPQYVELPGWDGEQVAKATSFKELPLETKQYLSFIQKQLGVPIIVTTTGPKRENLIEMPGYKI